MVIMPTTRVSFSSLHFVLTDINTEEAPNNQKLLLTHEAPVFVNKRGPRKVYVFYTRVTLYVCAAES